MTQNLYVDGTEWSLGETAWPTQLVKQFDNYHNSAEPYKSSEGILQSYYGYIRSLGQPDEFDTEQAIKNCVYVIEFPDPYNQTLWIPEYGTHVNVCGSTFNSWIADEELRNNPTDHFLELVEKQKAKLQAWTDLRGTAEVYNEQAKAINSIISHCRVFTAATRIIIKNGNHMPDGDALRSVFHPYMVTKTHHYLATPNQVLHEEHFNGDTVTDEGHRKYGTFVAKTLTRDNIIAKR